MGRISAIINKLHHKIHDEKIAFWGFFECKNSNEVASALFKHAERWVVEQGMQGMRGPMNPSINYECGLQISAFDTKPYIMMPQNPEYYINLVEQEGYKKVKDLQAWTVGMDEIAFDPKKYRSLKNM